MRKENFFPLGKCSYWLDVMKNPGNMVSAKRTRQNCLVTMGKNVTISIYFL
jgi:hypothetical protein